MKIGMTLPVTEPGWSRQALIDWAQGIDAGPYDFLALGERVCFPSPEVISTLSACAALTERVRLLSTVLILPAHDPVILAKQLSTIDVFSGGRLSVGVGTGGRLEDYAARSFGPERRRLSVLESHVDTMRQVWAGEYRVEGAANIVEPLPQQTGGPPLYAGVFGPKGIASASRWAEGVCGMSMSGEVSEASAAFQQITALWSATPESERASEKPVLGSAFWFALGEDARQQMQTHLYRYFNWLPESDRKAMAEGCGFCGSADDLRQRLIEFRDAGTDELALIPTSINVSDLEAATEVVASL